MSEIPEFMIRVKLPDSGAYAGSPSGDTEYDQAFHKAIFENKPPGFEVSWATRSTWPKDNDGYTWVRLYCSDRNDSLAYWMREAHTMSKKLKELKAAIEKLNI